MVESTPEAQCLYENICQYNTTLVFTSLGVKADNTITTRGGSPPTFCIYRELCCKLGSLLPQDGEHPVYAQLYISDPWVALEHQIL
ncbi:hypothetical protein BDM02DRAFT_3105157 [Thelephora ganbajun]|uniref:Uncharacterized protein n=1 Tax=Thelephora ganbajun TaxID=370292 RepID=A0ACB6Z0D1_THEGA|nr:hypothetical protein BDM02DRAFT_3105157 [Thelephora ganbajun]